MPKIDDIELPREIVEVLSTCLDGIPNDIIFELGKQFPGGFRDPKLIRDRIRTMIQGGGNLPVWLQNEIRLNIPECESTAALSFNLLQGKFDVLAAAAGYARLILALLMDERPEVRQFGKGRIHLASTVVSDETKSQAQGDWFSTVNACFASYTGWQFIMPDDTTTEIPADPVYVNRLEKEIADHELTVSNLKGKLEKERTARAEDRKQLTAAAKTNEERLAGELKSRDAQIKQLTDRLVSLEKALEINQSDMANSVQERVQVELAALERKWLVKATDLDSLATEGNVADLLKCVEEALEKQKLQDRQSGNRIELQRRLEQLRKAASQLADAGQNAIHPVNDLAGVYEQVTHEIARIDNKLGVPAAADGFLTRLIQQMNSSVDSKSLHEHEELAEQLHARGLITEEQARLCFITLQRRHDILASSNRSAVGQEAQSHWLSLRGLLHKNLETRLMLDGHNVLFALDYLKSQFENGKPGSKARNRLIELMRRLLKAHPRLDVRIFFDGPDENIENPGNNLQVIFSGGTGPQRADDKIVHYLKQHSLQNLKLHTFVVTNDRTLQARIKQNHAHYMPVAAFDFLLHELQFL